MPLPASELVFHLAEQQLPLTLWQDYILYTAGQQTFIPAPLPMVFAGYGIFAPEYDYNDYHHIDVANRIVVYLSGEPGSDDPEYFAGEQPTVYSDPLFKHRLAIARGARGTVMIPSPRKNRFLDWDYWVQQFTFEDVKLPYGVLDNLNVLLKVDAAWPLFTDAHHSLQDVFQFDRDGTMRSFELEARIRFKGEFYERDFVGQNVVAMLPGSDALLRDSYVIVAAHYDHLGVSTPVAGDSIYNGVIDNAIGVATTLEIARVIQKMAEPPHRSLLFLFVTGEEKGMLGSKFYCDQPAVPLHRTIAAINIDGIAILDRFRSLTGVGAAYSSLADILQVVASERNLDLAPPPPSFEARDPFLSSDHYSFARAGIPSILLMEGLDYCRLSAEKGEQRFWDWGDQIYHTPFDDLSQPIYYDAVQQHADILLSFILGVANSFVSPQWYPGVPYINARLQTIAENR